MRPGVPIKLPSVHTISGSVITVDPTNASRIWLKRVLPPLPQESTVHYNGIVNHTALRTEISFRCDAHGIPCPDIDVHQDRLVAKDFTLKDCKIVSFNNCYELDIQGVPKGIMERVDAIFLIIDFLKDQHRHLNIFPAEINENCL